MDKRQKRKKKNNGMLFETKILKHYACADEDILLRFSGQINKDGARIYYRLTLYILYLSVIWGLKGRGWYTPLNIG